MEYLVMIGILIGIIVSSVLLGCGTVYFFNRIPGQWLCDYGQEPDEELKNPTRQRLRSTPWKYIFTVLFVLIGIWLMWEGQVTDLESWQNQRAMVLENLGYGIATLLVVWLLVEVSVADLLYRIVPDQLVILLMVCGIGFIPFHDRGPMEGIWGGLIGLGVMLLIGIIGKLIYRKDTLGGGDIKLFGALGLVCGVDGILFVFLLTTLLSAAHIAFLLAMKRIKMTDQQPMVPYIALGTGIYMVLLREISYNILISI